MREVSTRLDEAPLNRGLTLGCDEFGVVEEEREGTQKKAGHQGDLHRTIVQQEKHQRV